MPLLFPSRSNRATLHLQSSKLRDGDHDALFSSDLRCPLESDFEERSSSRGAPRGDLMLSKASVKSTGLELAIATRLDMYDTPSLSSPALQHLPNLFSASVGIFIVPTPRRLQCFEKVFDQPSSLSLRILPRQCRNRPWHRTNCWNWRGERKRSDENCHALPNQLSASQTAVAAAR